MDECLRYYNITSAMSQGSALGHILGNVMYDELLCLLLPEEERGIGYAYNIRRGYEAHSTDGANV